MLAWAVGNERLRERRKGRREIVKKDTGTLIEKKLQRLVPGKHGFTLLGDCTERGVHGCECTVREHTIVH